MLQIKRSQEGRKQMKNRIILSLLLVLALPAGLGAQQPIPLSLQQAVEAALEPTGNTNIQDIVRGIFLKGSGLDVLWPQVGALAIFGVIILSLSALRFSKRLD